MACEGSPEVLAALEAIRQELARQRSEDDLDFRAGEVSVDAQLAAQRVLPAATVALNPGPPVDLVWTQFPKPRAVTLLIQSTVPPGTSATGSPVTLVITTALGSGATFSRTVSLRPGPLRSIRLIGRRITVTANITSWTGPQPRVQAAIVPFDENPLGELFGIWSPNTFALPAAAAVITGTVGTPGQGFFFGASGSLLTLGSGDSQEWLLVFDNNVAPSAADVALVSIGPLVASTAFGFDRSLRPDIQFNVGLTWAVSKTSSTYTAPGSGAAAFVDVDYGV